MKKTITIHNMSLLLCASLLSSCSFDKKGSATIFDGETQWNVWDYHFFLAETDDGSLALWGVDFNTEIGNSYRTLSLIMNTSEKGTFSGVFDTGNGKWSNSAINNVQLTVDYDGRQCPSWKGQSAIVTIHGYNKKTKAMSATVDAVVVDEKTNETRIVKVTMDNLHLAGRQQ